MSSRRLVSIDAFRGLALAGMLLVDYPGSDEDAFRTLRHAKWNGWTTADLVFPSFLFLVGTSIVLSFSSRLERGESRRAILLHAARRTGILFALGLFLNGFPHFHLAEWRIEGVLQRIAVCYLVSAALVSWTDWRGQAIVVGLCLFGYWALVRLVPVPGFGLPARDIPFLDPDRNLVAWLDRALFPGRLYNTTRDPEGVLSTIPAIATCLSGALTGQWLDSDRAARTKAAWMAGVGGSCVGAGLLWGLVFPINKNMWTSSFVVLTSGLALLVLALLYWAIDVRGWRGGWTMPLLVLGMNPIAGFIVDEAILPLVESLRFPTSAGTMNLPERIDEQLVAIGFAPSAASLVYSLGAVSFGWGLLWVLWRRRIFLKV
jgi:predicted acyltransferase